MIEITSGDYQRAIKKIFSDPAASAPLRRKGSIGGRLTLASKQALIDFTVRLLGRWNNSRRHRLVSASVST